MDENLTYSQNGYPAEVTSLTERHAKKLAESCYINPVARQKARKTFRDGRGKEIAGNIFDRSIGWLVHGSRYRMKPPEQRFKGPVQPRWYGTVDLRSLLDPTDIVTPNSYVNTQAPNFKTAQALLAPCIGSNNGEVKYWDLEMRAYTQTLVVTCCEETDNYGHWCVMPHKKRIVNYGGDDTYTVIAFDYGNDVKDDTKWWTTLKPEEYLDLPNSAAVCMIRTPSLEPGLVEPVTHFVKQLIYCQDEYELASAASSVSVLVSGEPQGLVTTCIGGTVFDPAFY